MKVVNVFFRMRYQNYSVAPGQRPPYGPEKSPNGFDKSLKTDFRLFYEIVLEAFIFMDGRQNNSLAGENTPIKPIVVKKVSNVNSFF